MTTTTSSGNSLRILIILACFVIIVAGIRAAGAIMAPFFLAVFIASICAPILFWLKRFKIPTGIAIVLMFIIISVIAILLVTFVGSSITEFSRRVPVYQKQLEATFVDYLGWFDKFGIELSSDIVFQYFDPGTAMKLAANTLTRLRGILANAFFIALTVIFILLEATSFPRKLTAAFAYSDHSLKQFKLITLNINRYLAMKTLTSLLTGGLITLLLFFIGVDFPLLWGMVAFLLNYVPAIGSIIASVPAILLALVQLDGLHVMYTLMGYLCINVIIGSVVEPRLFGSQIGLSPLVVLLSLIFWGWVLGPVGMLLSVPLTMILKIALEGNEETKWLAILLGSDKPEQIGLKAGE